MSLVPLWLPVCLLLLLAVGRDGQGCSSGAQRAAAFCAGRSALVMSSLLRAPLLLLPGASNQRSLCGGSFVNTAAAAPSWPVTLAREAGSSRPLKCVDLQLISGSLDFSCQ